MRRRKAPTPTAPTLRSRIAAIVDSGFAFKRWMLLPLLGVLLSGLGMSLIVTDLVVLSRIPVLLRNLLLDWSSGLILLIVGLAFAAFGLWRLNREMISFLLEREEVLDNLEIVDALVARRQQRKRRTGPRIVVIGGGTGMPTLLRGLQRYTENITAVVTVADDGGSSGRLRRQMGMLPPGDFRNNIAALSESEGLMTQLLQYRFGDKDGLSNHNFGNLFITTMAAITGSFERGIAESSRVLAVRGRILPSTLENVTLCAEIALPPSQEGDLENSGEERWAYVRGESRIPDAGGRILRVYLEPEDCRAYPETVQAILRADLIIAAPGSFFTSLLPNLLVPYVRAAICASNAVRVYVCNVATQAGETDHFTVSDHMRHLRQHAGDAFTHVLANDAYDPAQPPSANVQWVTLPTEDEALDYTLDKADLVDAQRPWRHDPQKVAAQVMAI
ncbi:MAG: YvcK family protein, partial [Caldilineaceae bacterium]|nr:YvcK family protein [Caldilineaceae bacterium]